MCDVVLGKIGSKEAHAAAAHGRNYLHSIEIEQRWGRDALR